MTARPALPLGEVHVWRTRLDRPAAYVERFRRTLAADEQGRADRFHFPADRQRFIVGRGLLRVILGHYLARGPDQLRFGYNPQGKPALSEEQRADALRFNVSHSHGLALIAVTRGREVGVDLERVAGDVEVDQIAERFFSPRERDALRAVPADCRRQAFFTCWTRKEAYLKARGTGLSLPLDGFDVSLAPGEPAALLATRDDPREAGRWSLRGVTPARGYVGAVAVEGAGWRLRCGDWSDDGGVPGPHFSATGATPGAVPDQRLRPTGGSCRE